MQGPEATGSPSSAGNGARATAIAMYCVLLLAYVLMAADRYLFPVLAADVRKEFGFSLANTGLLSTIFTLGLGIGGVPTGYLLSRFSRKTVIMTGIVIFSTAIALTTVSVGFWMMLLSLAATGVGMSMLATSMFALAASYFARYRAAAIGSVNLCYGLGGFVGPILAGMLLTSYGTWHAPMRAFALFGIALTVVIALTVRPWFSETRHVAHAGASTGGALTLLNRNTVLLSVLSMLQGLGFYGFLGMYPSFLRENLQYSAELAGFVISFFGVGALTSIFGGWLGDKLSPRVVLSGAFLCAAALGYLLFQESATPLTREILTFFYGVTGSAILYVNLAGYHVKAVKSHLAGRASGLFVTSLYGGASLAGYLLGAIASYAGWETAGEIQIAVFSTIGAVLALALRPREMAL